MKPRCLPSSAGWTGISFPQLNGPSLTIYGHDLTREQQLLAFAIFRSVRSGYVADGAFIEELGASAPTPQVFHSGGPAVTSFVYEGVEYEPVAGPIRAELLDVERLKSTGLMLTDKELLKGSEGRRVYTLSGVPIEEGFLVGSMQTGFGRPDIWYLRTETAYPVCQPGSSALIYTAVGASPPPPPYGPVTPQPSYTGGPTPTPRPTPATPVVAAPLSSKGLLDAGWPQVNMERLQVGLGGGVEYLHTSSRYINEYNLDTSIPSAALEELETLAISYFIDVGPLPSPLLDEMASDAAVTDHVRVYRLTARPIEEVIVVDQCPADLHGDQFVLYLPKEDKAHIDDDDSMSRGVELTAIRYPL